MSSKEHFANTAWGPFFVLRTYLSYRREISFQLQRFKFSRVVYISILSSLTSSSTSGRWISWNFWALDSSPVRCDKIRGHFEIVSYKGKSNVWICASQNVIVFASSPSISSIGQAPRIYFRAVTKQELTIRGSVPSVMSQYSDYRAAEPSCMYQSNGEKFLLTEVKNAFSLETVQEKPTESCQRSRRK